MNFYTPKPLGNFYCEMNLQGSKSITNRALILAALSDKRTVIKNILLSDDTKYMIEALKKLGNKITFLSSNSLEIIGNSKPNFDSVELFIGNAGTALRFLLSYLAIGKGTAILTGIDRMKERPIKSLCDTIIKLGAKIEYLEKEGFPPIKIITTGILGDSIEIDGSLSSQYISSILMVAPFLSKNFKLYFKGKIVSKPYINLTLEMMRQFGVNSNFKENYIEVCSSPYSISEYTVEGDMSSASYFLAMALITNSKIKINNFIKNSLQGDYNFLNILTSLGLKILEESDTSIVVEGCESYNGIDLNMNDIPDIAQTMAVVALFASSPTTVTDVENMRIKETDRISALKKELTKIGVDFIEFKDGFKIFPKDSYNGNVTFNTYDDHRMAMSLSLIGLKLPGIKISNPECVSKTFPTYFEEFNKIYHIGG